MPFFSRSQPKSKVFLVTFGGWNAGDYYSDPSLHFTFAGVKLHRILWRDFPRLVGKGIVTPQSTVIFGGGGCLDATSQRTKFYGSLPSGAQLIHWGSGSNRPNPEGVKRVLNDDELNSPTDTCSSFNLVGLRDYQGQSRSGFQGTVQYIPCASAMMKELEEERAPQRDTGRIDHAWLAPKHSAELDHLPAVGMDLRKHSISTILRFISESETIVTSSYHAAFWSLLMGKRTVVEGNTSSKFEFLQFPAVFYSGDLDSDIGRAKPAPFPAFLNHARRLNIDFHSEVMGILKPMAS